MTGSNAPKKKMEVQDDLIKPETKLIKDLISEGREKGFITLDDINNHLGNEPVNSEQMEQIFNLLSEMGMDVLDTPKKENANKSSKKSKKKQEEVVVEVESEADEPDPNGEV